MLRVVISAVTEFMVRVLHLRMLWGIHDAACRHQRGDRVHG
jgi:hypothetical protein